MSPREIAKPLVGVADDILDLSKRVLGLSEKLDDLGNFLLTNGDALKTTGKLTPGIRKKLNVQGKRFKNIQGTVKNTGEIFKEIGEKMGKISGKLREDIDKSESLSELGEKLKIVGEQIKVKGGVVENLSIKLQKMQPNKRDDNEIEKPHNDNIDNENADDIAGMLKALGGIADSLGQMFKVQ